MYLNWNQSAGPESSGLPESPIHFHKNVANAAYDIVRVVDASLMNHFLRALETLENGEFKPVEHLRASRALAGEIDTAALSMAALRTEPRLSAFLSRIKDAVDNVSALCLMNQVPERGWKNAVAATYAEVTDQVWGILEILRQRAVAETMDGTADRVSEIVSMETGEYGESETFHASVIESNRVHIYGQGIFDERGNRIDDEVLVRGVRPDGSIVFPDELLEGIGKIGHYDTFDWLVIENACAYISAAGKHNETYGVNVNPITLCRPDFFEKMSGMFRKYGVNPRNIIVEILECGEFEGSDSATVDKTLKSLRELGVRIAIDDYPAQSNTLARVSMLENIDIVKIDGIHVMEMFNTCESCEAADACSAFIASSSSRNQDMCLRDLKHDYKLETLVFSMRFLKYNYPHLKFFAERVEDANVLAFLKRLGFVEGFQGYHFEKPRLLASSDTLRESFQGIRLSDALEERASAGLPKVSEVVPGDAGNVLLVSDSALSDEILRADSFAASAVELSAFFRAGNSIADVNSTYSTSEAMETVLKHLNADRISFYSDDGTKISVETYSTGGTFEVTEIPSFPEHSRVDKKNLNLYRLSLGNSEPERFGFDISRYPVPGEGDDIVVRVGEGRYVGIDDSERAVYRTEAAKLNFLLLFVSAVSRW